MNIFILCTGNYACSILLEAFFNIKKMVWFKALSAGSKSIGADHAHFLYLIKSKNDLYLEFIFKVLDAICK